MITYRRRLTVVAMVRRKAKQLGSPEGTVTAARNMALEKLDQGHSTWRAMDSAIKYLEQYS